MFQPSVRCSATNKHERPEHIMQLMRERFKVSDKKKKLSSSLLSSMLTVKKRFCHVDERAAKEEGFLEEDQGDTDKAA